MRRAYISISSAEVANHSNEDLLGRLAGQLLFPVEPTQRAAWQFQIDHLRKLAHELPDAHFFFEFLIPRMGRRADLIILNGGLVFVVEYKLGANRFDRTSIEQCHGYALDLKNFHETSHDRAIVPVLVATHAQTLTDQPFVWAEDQVATPLCLMPDELSGAINHATRVWGGNDLRPDDWEAGRYRPTPTIVEAAQALYGKHSVEEISRSEAGAENLSVTADYVFGVIERAKAHNEKAVCFITGVPGSGKTLAGLNLATARQRANSDEHAVFLSGNGPLVEVLREALARDAVERVRSTGQRTTKAEEARRTSSFVQNIHHFRDDALRSNDAPIEKVAIFDEAQRAWDSQQTAKFMKERGRLDFAMSEPEFLLSVMDRHDDWCTVICLVGGGQEINTGEAGIDEWLRALAGDFSHWAVHVSDRLESSVVKSPNLVRTSCLHLATSIRSFRAEKLSDFVSQVIEGTGARARELVRELEDFPIVVTRDLEKARRWLRSHRRGTERAGLLASSNGARLKPHGVFVKAGIDPANWFLNPSSDVRSSDALEDSATEFEVQGLELDWTCVCWDANFFRRDDTWHVRQFKGSSWQNVSDVRRRRYIANSYRVLLTRARQGMVIFVPPGDLNDLTRNPTDYDGVYEFLRECGIPELRPSDESRSAAR